MRRSSNISRRSALKGLGVSIALPMLEAMRAAPSRAGSADRADAPLRVAFLYVPNGAHMQDWTPKGVGSLDELPFILEPLKPVKDDVLVLSGLTLDKALGALESSSLRLGKTESRTVGDAKPGTIVNQTPEPGVKIAAGTPVNVVVVRPQG